MIFGEKVTQYEQFLIGTYGYIIRLDTAPNIRKIVSIQCLNSTIVSNVLNTSSLITDLMQMPLDINCPDLAYASESGIIYLFFKTTIYPYVDATTFLLMAYRYPRELQNLTSELDIMQGDLELFMTLSIAVAAELQGKLIPQRILDKIQYLKDVITLEKNT